MSTKVTVDFETANAPQQAGKMAAQRMQDAVRESIFNNAIYGKGGVVDYGKIYPVDWIWPGHRYSGVASTIPSFIEPERPATPEPEAVSDTPAVAMLRTLLDDRKSLLAGYEAQIESSQEAIKEAELELVNLRADLDHEKACAAAADAEVEQIKADIVKLGGTVD